jgi:hypothetical protein
LACAPPETEFELGCVLMNMNLRELRAELRKLKLPTAGRKRELELRLEAAQSTVLDKDATTSLKSFQDEVVLHSAEKPYRMKEVKKS